jgi:hypothetical protein
MVSLPYAVTPWSFAGPSRAVAAAPFIGVARRLILRLRRRHWPEKPVRASDDEAGRRHPAVTPR